LQFNPNMNNLNQNNNQKMQQYNGEVFNSMASFNSYQTTQPYFENHPYFTQSNPAFQNPQYSNAYQNQFQSYGNFNQNQSNSAIYMPASTNGFFGGRQRSNATMHFDFKNFNQNYQSENPTQDQRNRESSHISNQGQTNLNMGIIHQNSKHSS
jgi:hypothetical protein